MTGIDQSGHGGRERGPEAGGSPDPVPANGSARSDPDPARQASSSTEDDGPFDEIIEGGVTTEIIDGTAPELDDVAAAEAQRDEYLDSLRRLQAEFENYKKRVVKQQADQVARAAVSLVEKVLPVLDTLDLATQHLGDTESPEGRALVAVAGQLLDVLAKEGLERIDPLGETFDPNAHEAVGHLPAEGPGEAGADGDAGAVGDGPAPGEPVVGQVMRAGYRWRGTVVRPAMVMVRG